MRGHLRGEATKRWARPAPTRRGGWGLWVSLGALAGLLMVSCGGPPELSRPNILWLMSDELRADGVGAYGSPWAQTPNLDRLAAEGALFRHALTPGPVCVPARASILTGRYPSEIGIWWNIRSYEPDLSDLPVLDHLTEVFHEAGYRSASFGKRHYNSVNNAFQTESHFALSELVGYYRYREPLEGSDYDWVQYPPSPYAWIIGGRFPGPAEEKSEARAVREAIAWLSGHDPSVPFFLRLSFNAPHTPVVPPEPFDTIIDSDAIQLPEEAESAPTGEPDWIATALRSRCDAGRLSREQVLKARRYYYGEVAFLDSQIGKLLDWMGANGQLDNTIVVVVSDHGTHLGDYGLVAKQTFYEPVVNVPFLFWYPKAIVEGKIFETPVETRSLLPTLIELAGLAIAEPQNYAPSLALSLRSGTEPESRPVFSEQTLASFDVRPDDRLVLVRDGDWKLSVAMTPEPAEGALYNLKDDPHERRNLFADPAFSNIRDRLTQMILEHLGETQ